ncbi:alpha/beta hydrolase [Pseudonocardia sp. GCM10023141]|uniref:alpha/beta hydrolase n=1 Tax=Pseudonocardia sp. GCM10023141 TaxID=3252653 RepID=UPI00360B3837
MDDTKTAMLTVPGATLYYEVRGAGPTVLLICGGIYDAAALAGLAGLLAERYTVITYDRRGNSRSPLDGAPEPFPVDVHADDAHRLLTAVGGTEPAFVFGNSAGGLIGLALAARHPEQVGAVVSHEPPVLSLLPDAARWAQVLEQVHATYVSDGVEAAMGQFGAAMGMADGGGQPPMDQLPPEVAEMLGRFARNTEVFVGYEIIPFGAFTPDVAALRAGSPRVVLAAGADSAGEPPHLAALAVAERLGTEAVLFPGDHGGFGTHTDGFATELQKIFSAS